MKAVEQHESPDSRDSCWWSCLVSLIILLALGLPFASTGQAQPSGSASQALVRAHYTAKPPTLDGRPTEKAWQQAEKVRTFTQRELKVGEPVTERTQTAVVYTQRYLYIGIWCYDSNPGGILAKELRRDFNSSNDDNFKVILDTYGDNRNGFLFVTNPNGARRDAQVLNNGNSVNTSWDGVWNVEARQTAEGWFAEMKIPFTTLKYDADREEQRWGINFERNIRRKREQVLWQGWSRDYSIRQVNQAGTLGGLDSLLDKDFIELKPYGVTGAQFDENQEGRYDLGGNVNYLVTPTVRAQVTVNTDFAQVESDPQQINLTRFPLRFPEKREFFLEGRDYFNMGFGGNRVEPFYSRRIGLTPDRQQVPILAGTRLLGKIRNSTVGFMSLQTQQQDSLPSTNYTVGSFRQNVLRQSTAGFMSVNKLTPEGMHTTTGINGQYRTSRLFGDKNFNISGALVHTRNSEEAYDPEANAYRVSVQYPNDKLSIFTSFQSAPDQFQPEVGLRRRPDFREAFGSVTFKPRPGEQLPWIRQFRFTPFTLTYTYFHTTQELQTFSWTVKPLGFDTKSGESLDFSINRSGEGVQEAFQLQDETTVPAGEYWQTRYSLNMSSFSGRTVSGALSVDWGGFFTGRSVESQYSLRWRASEHIDISADYNKNWITLPNSAFDTDLIGTRLKYAVNPDVFGSVYTQWNDRDELANMNFRLEWIPKVGTNFFLIVNQNLDTSYPDWRNERTTILGKLIWRFVI